MTVGFPSGINGKKMNAEEFEELCLKNRDLRIERNNILEVSVKLPNIPLDSLYLTQWLCQLSNWNFENKRGVVFGSSAGFTLPDNSILSPDASWMSNKKWNNLSENEKDKFSHVCPELESKFDRKATR